jgi:hypothetical protein
LDDVRRGITRSGGSRARFYTNRDILDLHELIGAAEHQVDILTTNLNYFGDSRSEAIGRAISNGATVRIVTMDPESVIAEYRAKQLSRGQDIPSYRRELRNGILNLCKKFGTKNNFHLHLYNDLPLQITTRVDNSIITSVVTRGERARKRIQIRFNLSDDGVTDSFVSHFQSMFDNSTDVKGASWIFNETAHISIFSRKTDRVARAKK